MKIGDKITCVELDAGLVLGKEYQVFSYEPTWCGRNTPVITVAQDGAPYYADFFILTNTTKNKENNMKIGQKIKCINSQDSESLCHGYTYMVTHVNQYGNIQVKLDGSKDPLQHYYKPNRFELVADSVAPSTIDITKSYKTRKGLEVELFAISDDPTYPVVGQYLMDDGSWVNEQWTLEGKYTINSGFSEFDLVERKTQESFSILGNKGFFWSDGSITLNDTPFSKEAFTKIIQKYEEFNS